MRALLCKTFGAPETLVLDDIPAPSPADGEVRIRVLACGLNFPDVLMVAGKYQVQPPMPFSPGAEVCGEVVEAGKNSSNVRSGQRVIAITGHGGLAEQVCVPASAIVPIPDEIPAETAAGFLLAYGTAYHALKQRACLRAGETLLVLGAAGGVGLAAVELGKVLEARVIAAAGTPQKCSLAQRYGADHVIDYSQQGLKDAVREVTGGHGAEVIFDPVGGPLFDDCLRSVAWNGRILVIGFAGGTIQKIPANLPLLKGSAVVGVFWGKFVQKEPEASRENTAQLVTWLRDGRISPHVSSVHPLEDAAFALDILATRRALGKVVVRVAG